MLYKESCSELASSLSNCSWMILGQITWLDVSESRTPSLACRSPFINVGRVDEFDPGLVDANDFLHFSRKAVSSLWSQEIELLYGSSIINTSKRKSLFSGLYSEVKFAKLCPLEIQWITYGSINILTTEHPLFFFQKRIVKVNKRYEPLSMFKIFKREIMVIEQNISYGISHGMSWMGCFCGERSIRWARWCKVDKGLNL